MGITYPIPLKTCLCQDVLVGYKLVKIGGNEKDPTDTYNPMMAEINNRLLWKTIGSTGILVSAHTCYPNVLADIDSSFYGAFILSSIKNDGIFSSDLLPASISTFEIKSLHKKQES